MSSRFQRTSLWFCVLAGGLAAVSSAYAEPAQSLAERRLSIIKRSSSGIVLIDLPSEQRAAMVAAGTTPATAPTTAGSATAATAASPQPSAAGTGTTANAAPAKTAEATTPQPAVLNRFFSTMPAPSGRSLQEARRLDAPDQGVLLPFARPTPQPAAEPDAKR